MSAEVRFLEAVRIMERLRAPGGCPWDREQTFDSIRKYTLEETYEVLDAIERRDWVNLREELGDLLLQVLFYAEVAREEELFTLDEVLEGLTRKLVRRHPHVFGEAASAAAGNQAERLQIEGIGSDTVLANWSTIKDLEKRSQVSHEVRGRLHPVPRAMPALVEAAKLGSSAARCGFDWPDAVSLVAKVREEADEIERELDTGTRALAEEVGDLLFTVANLARKLKLDPEMTLRDASSKFRRRFAGMEAASAAPLEELGPEQLEALWAEVKSVERESLPKPAGTLEQVAPPGELRS